MNDIHHCLSYLPFFVEQSCYGWDMCLFLPNTNFELLSINLLYNSPLHDGQSKPAVVILQVETVLLK